MLDLLSSNLARSSNGPAGTLTGPKMPLPFHPGACHHAGGGPFNGNGLGRRHDDHDAIPVRRPLPAPWRQASVPEDTQTSGALAPRQLSISLRLASSLPGPARRTRAEGRAALAT